MRGCFCSVAREKTVDEISREILLLFVMLRADNEFASTSDKRGARNWYHHSRQENAGCQSIRDGLLRLEVDYGTASRSDAVRWLWMSIRRR